MFILSINTRDDSLMIGSSEIKKTSHFFLKIDHIIFSSEFFLTLLLCVGHINLPEILSFFVVVFLVQSANCPFFFLFFAFFLRWFTISTDGGQQNC